MNHTPYNHPCVAGPGGCWLNNPTCGIGDESCQLRIKFARWQDRIRTETFGSPWPAPRAEDVVCREEGTFGGQPVILDKRCPIDSMMRFHDLYPVGPTNPSHVGSKPWDATLTGFTTSPGRRMARFTITDIE